MSCSFQGRVTHPGIFVGFLREISGGGGPKLLPETGQSCHRLAGASGGNQRNQRVFGATAHFFGKQRGPMVDVRMNGIRQKELLLRRKCGRLTYDIFSIYISDILINKEIKIYIKI